MMYDILLEIRKDTRNTSVQLTVEIVDAIPPIMEIECADELLCHIGAGGKIYINPTSHCTKHDTSRRKPVWEWKGWQLFPATIQIIFSVSFYK